MTEAERKAMEYLDGLENTYSKMLPGSVGHSYLESILTLKAMLSRPVLPKKLTQEILHAMHLGYNHTHGSGYERMAGVYRALYAHLTAPKTKEVEVEQWAIIDGNGDIWACDHKSEESAQAAVKRMAGFTGTFHAVRLTGKATVPSC